MRVIAIVAWAMALAAAQPAQEPEAIPDFGGKYSELTPRQKALFDDLFRRFTAVSGVDLEPTEAYDQARLSTHHLRSRDARARQHDSHGRKR